MRIFNIALGCLSIALLAPSCSIFSKDSEESAPPPYEEAKPCTTDTECASGMRCAGERCVAATCADDRLNGSETDIDCGGSACPPCGDTKACIESTDCASKNCGKEEGAEKGACIPATHDDGIQNLGETDVDCGGSIASSDGDMAPRCGIGQGCESKDDCMDDKGNVLACDVGNTNKCLPPTHSDGVKNLDETGVDCGGPSVSTRCAVGDGCKQTSDCDNVACDVGKTNLCLPPSSHDGIQNGTETDKDCGGGAPTNAPACEWGLKCLADSDCTSTMCNPATKQCLSGPSCKVQNGGQTCGPNGNEDCCRSLPVTGYGPIGGKTVYLDKYEITAGRMRAFVDAVTAAMGGVPDIYNYMKAHRPTRWNDAWGAVLPQAYSDTQPEVRFTVSNPTPGPAASGALFGYLYPGPDIVPNQLYNVYGSPMIGTYSIWPGIFETFGEEPFFPEYSTDNARYHNLNCANKAGSYGLGTYWFPPSGNINRQFSQADADRRALNCTTNAMFAAFCAWDGGQLVTEDVMSYVVGGTTWSSGVSVNCTGTNGACRIGSSGNCAGANMTSDSTQGCYSMDGYEPSANESLDASGRIFVPGSVSTDVYRIDNAVDEGWYDIKGNLIEIVVSDDDRFKSNGFGIGYSSMSNHRGQIVTARFKSGSAGARCMRLK